MNKNLVMNRFCEIAVAYAATYVGVHSAPRQKKFIKLVNWLGIHKNTIIFKINVFF